MCFCWLRSALPRAISVTTADRNGADAYVSNDNQSASYGPASLHGTNTSIQIRYLVDTRCKIGYLRFDITGLGGDMTGATLSMETTSVKSGGKIVNVYGLTDQSLDSWDEAAICYNNAPGMLPPTPAAGRYTIDPTKLTLLGTFTTPTAAGVMTSDPTVLVLGSFLEADENGLVTLVLIDTGNGEDQYATKENTNTALQRPTLTLPNAGLGSKTSASGPNPADKATDAYRDTNLSWIPSKSAQTHDVYLGTNEANVTNADVGNPLGVLVSQGQDANTCDPTGHLSLGQTYFWRVDEVNSTSSTVFKGKVWSFTVEAATYQVTPTAVTASSFETGKDPNNTINNSGMNTSDQHSTESSKMWLTAKSTPGPVWIQYAFDRVYKLTEMKVWNYNVDSEDLLGFGLKTVTLAYSADNVTWTTLGDFELTQAPATADYAGNTPTNLGGIAARYLRLDVKSNWGTFAQYGLSEVRFFQTPAHARTPSPASGDANLPPDVTLSWRTGRESALSKVYLGTDANALPLAGQITADSFVPSLTLGRTYYWRVDEVNDAATPSLWTGDLWSFSTRPYNVIDDFESYNDTDNAVFDTWRDGYGTQDNGMQTGNASYPYAEKTILHGGAQSMPLFYDNTGTAVVSEAQRSWDTAQDWTAGGADTLRLFFRGCPAGVQELASDHIIMSGIGTDLFGAADQGRFFYKQLTGDGSIIARVDSLVDTDPFALAGVMIRQSTDAASAYFGAFLTGSNGVRFRARSAVSTNATSDTGSATTAQTALVEPVWIKIERVGNIFTGYYSADGKTWTTMAWPAQTISMGSTLCIGLAVCSHNATAITTAEFSNITFSSNVSGSWTNADLGIAQTSNAADQLYVTLKDFNDKSKTVLAAADAVLQGTWQEWPIPLSSFTGVNLNRVKSMIIGVGDKTTPKKGKGTLYIDDLAVGHPAQ